MRLTTSLGPAILLVVTLSLPTGATERYVAIGGTDSGPGTNAISPWATITYAVSNSGSNDTVHVGPGIYTENEINFSGTLTLLGAGATQTIVQAAATPGTATNRVLNFHSSSVCAVSDLTVRNGRSLDGEAGGIRNSGSLTLTRVNIISNMAASVGGGIRSQVHSLRLSDCRIEGNTAATNGGGIEFYAAPLIASNVTFCGNTAGASGGGFYNNGATGSVWNSSIVSNRALGGAQCGGGGIANEGPLTLVNCTVSFNSALQDGGGIRNNITNLTLWVRHCTIAFNSAANRGGGLDSTTAEPIVLGDTILSGNTAALNPDTFATYLSENYNLIQNTSGATLGGINSSNVIGRDALLGPLQNNGGPTPTHAPATNSPAINAGNPAFAAPPATDQRGAPRVQRGRVDIGAYEVLEADQDGDGMDGQWEFVHGLNPTNAADAAVDSDGDGCSNLAEYTADTDPWSAASRWCLTSIVATGRVSVGFFSSSARVYDLESSGNLATNQWKGVVGHTNVAGIGGPFTITDTNAANPRYYRVRVRVP